MLEGSLIIDLLELFGAGPQGIESIVVELDDARCGTGEPTPEPPAVVADAPPAELAQTGSESPWIAAAAGALVMAVGIVAVRLPRRIRQ